MARRRGEGSPAKAHETSPRIEPLMPDEETDWNVEWAAPAAPSSEHALDRPAGSRAAGSVGFCDEGLVSPTHAVPILESLNDSSSPVAEEMRLLAAKVHDIRRERGIGCLAFTSTGPGEGKSTVSLGLAAALAREPGRRILLVEADLRRPSLASTLGLPPAPGLGEWLNGAFEYVPVRLVQPGGFFLLVAGRVELERPELLGSPRMDHLLRAARGLFDFVILDATPLLPVADAVLIQDLVDAFLLVVRSRQTARDAIRDAINRLRPDRVIGVILNEHYEPRSSYMTQAYQRYGMSYESPAPRSRRR